MRVVVTGATGNVGTSLIEALAGEARVESILGLARRTPAWEPAKTEWAVADVAASDLAPHFAGADAVVHLAWLIQPSRDLPRLHAANVVGTKRVLEAAAQVDVPALLYASSVGAYSKGPKDRPVDETWPTGGIPTSFYSRHKAEVERLLDAFERERPSTRVIRMRPGLIFKDEAASEIRRLFAGPFVPNLVGDRRLIPVAPRIRGLRFQAVHSRDVGEAFRLALIGDVQGAFNLAADPPIGPDELSGLLRARQVPVPRRAARVLTDLTWRLHLQPSEPGWLDMALSVPLMDASRARSELGWAPRHTAVEALAELLEGLRRGSGVPTPPLEGDAGEHSRADELRSRIGSRP